MRSTSRSAGTAHTAPKAGPDRRPRSWGSSQDSGHAGPKGEAILNLPEPPALVAAIGRGFGDGPLSERSSGARPPARRGLAHTCQRERPLDVTVRSAPSRGRPAGWPRSHGWCPEGSRPSRQSHLAPRPAGHSLGRACARKHRLASSEGPISVSVYRLKVRDAVACAEASALVSSSRYFGFGISDLLAAAGRAVFLGAICA